MQRGINSFTGLCCLFVLATFTPSAKAISEKTPDDNKQLRTELIAETTGSLAAQAFGLIPVVDLTTLALSASGEVANFALDLALANTAPTLIPPADEFVMPDTCFFQADVPPDTDSGVIETGIGSYYFIPYKTINRDFFTNKTVFGDDLGEPEVFHPNGSVNVSLTSPIDDFNFPEGRHVLEWKAETQLNVITDIALPGVLTLIGLYSDVKSALKPTAKAAKEAAEEAAEEATEQAAESATVDILQELLFNLAIDWGVIGSNEFESVEKFYELVSATSARNTATQTLTVWDINPPYFIPAEGADVPITSQERLYEATDFGGVRFGRVREALRGEFKVVDDCGERFLVVSQTDNSTLLKVGQTTPVIWQVVDDGPFEPGFSPLDPNQQQVGEEVVATLIQQITVEDTQAPILVPPPGIARESATPINISDDLFALGRPQIVDLADPVPTFERTPLDELVPGNRYEVLWKATDASGNSTDDSEQYKQLVTVKFPGTNTAPEAEAKSAGTRTSKVVEIELTGIDTDELDGRVDPLDFRITQSPQRGDLESPLTPFFIEDFRLSPVGESEKPDNSVGRVSPLGAGLANDFRLAEPRDRGNLLEDEICEAEPGSPNQERFDNVIPVDFVYSPRYVHVDDDGFYYIQDHFWQCGERFVQTNEVRLSTSPLEALDPIPRVSKWTPEGELVAMHELYPLTGKDYPPGTLRVQTWIDQGFNFDATGRIWFQNAPLFTANFASVKSAFSFDKNLQGLQPHGTTDYPAIAGIGRIIGFIADSTRSVLYELHWIEAIDQAVLRVFPYGEDYILPDLPELFTGPFGGGWFDPDVVCQFFYCIPGAERGTDIEVDPDGFVYVLEPLGHRIHKMEPAYQDESGTWQVGDYIGWNGGCTSNKTNQAGVPFFACDEEAGTSFGYQCTDEKCDREFGSTPFQELIALPGDKPGQFNNPSNIEIDPNGFMYVADTDNFRVQRFGQDGNFAGQAKSTGTGINQGDEPGFILGNFAQPKQLSVNSSSLYIIEPDTENEDNFVHVFKTLPFFDITDSSATVKYRSDFDFQGTDNFAYVVDDGLVDSEPATVSVLVERSFRPPFGLEARCYTAVDLETQIPCRLDEDTSLLIRISSKDLDGFISTGGLDQHQFEILKHPEHGELSPLEQSDNGIVYRYTPELNFNGEDSFSFRAFEPGEAPGEILFSDEPFLAKITVEAKADPVEISLDDPIMAARGFPRLIQAEFADVDDDNQPQLRIIRWGDGSEATALEWQNAGRQDPEGKNLSPQLDAGSGEGFILASHTYDAVRKHNLVLEMDNVDEGESLPPSIASATVEVIEATVVSTRLAAPTTPVPADTPFALEIDISNQQPDGWAGLQAKNTRVMLEIPDGMEMDTLDPRCSEGNSDLIDCMLGTLQPGETIQLKFLARLLLESAQEQNNFLLKLSVTDDGPKISELNQPRFILSVVDRDEDGVLDADDAFPRDPRYSQDSDGDGQADRWEVENGFDPNDPTDALQDTDDDGAETLVEFLADSPPRLANLPARLRLGDTLTGSADGDQFGFVLASGDVNGDGYIDVVIGAPTTTNIPGEVIEGSGTVHLYTGTPGGELIAADILLSDGPDQFGAALTVADFDSNGFDDIAVGMEARDQRVYLYFSDADGINPQPIQVLGNTDSNFGGFLQSGDLDNDGRPDLLISDNFEDGPLGSDQGAVYVYLAKDGFFEQAQPQPSTVLYGPEAGAVIGDSLAIGDIDGDLEQDLIVGASFRSDPGEVYLYLGANIRWSAGEPITPSKSLTVNESGDRYGSSVSVSGDVDGDGIDDLLVGAYGINQQTGAAYLYLSSSRYWEEVNPDFDQSLPGSFDGERFGIRLALVEGIDRSGFADAIIGADRSPTRFPDQAEPPDQGRVQRFLGTPQGLLAAEEFFGPVNSRLGYFVIGAGDINNDGLTDVAAGAPYPAIDNPGLTQLLIAGPLATEPDGDGDAVADRLDNCVTVENKDQSNVDGDPNGDACDDNIDGDQWVNEDDNCRFLANDDQADFDQDSAGDACDLDDDNDGMPDGYETDQGFDPLFADDGGFDSDNDGFTNRQEFERGSDPFDPSDGRVPSITAPPAMTVEATGITTPVALGEAMATDDEDGPLTAVPDTLGPFALGSHVVTWTATNSIGISNSATQVINVVDTTPPVFDAPPPQVLDALHYFNVIEPEPFDIPDTVDGLITVFPLLMGPYRSGRHEVIWQAADSSGNSASQTQQLDLRPAANLVLNPLQVRTLPLTFQVSLAGDAPVYPVEVDYRVTDRNQQTLHSATVRIDAGRMSAPVALDLADDIGNELFIKLASPVNAYLGEAASRVVQRVERNEQVPLRLAIALNQAGAPASRVFTGAGPVLLRADVECDPAQCAFDWSSSAAELVALLSALDQPDVELDPSTLAPGLYQATLRVARNSGTPLSAKLVFAVVAGQPALSAQADSDNDGLGDQAEGFRDLDGDGLADYLDPIDSPLELQPALANGINTITTFPGSRLRIGESAIRADRLGYAIQPEDVLTASGEPALDSGFSSSYPVFDFVIESVPQAGEAVTVVINLAQPLPAGSVLREYQPQTGWMDFIETDVERIASAPCFADGHCPAANSAQYSPGLVTGAQCVRLTIRDGGPNDADGEANGRIVDPLRLALPATAGPMEPPGGEYDSHGGGSGRTGWLFLVLLLLGGLCQRRAVTWHKQ